MHAVFVTVKVEDVEAAQAHLRDEVVPRVAQAPGFVAGYWLAPEGDRGNSIVVFESEEAARSAAESLQPPPQVTLESHRGPRGNRARSEVTFGRMRRALALASIAAIAAAMGGSASGKPVVGLRFE